MHGNIEEEIMHFQYMTINALAQEPLPGGHVIYNFGKPFLGHHYYILGMSYLCLGVKTIFKEIMQFHKLSYMITLLHKNPCPRGHDIYNFGRPFVGHHFYILSFFLSMPVSKEEDL